MRVTTCMCSAISGDSWCYFNRNNDTSLKKLVFPGKRAKNQDKESDRNRAVTAVQLVYCLHRGTRPGVDMNFWNPWEASGSLTWKMAMIQFLVGIPTPLKNMSSSVGVMTFPTEWRNPWETHSFNCSESHLHLWIIKFPWLSNIPEANPNCIWPTQKCVTQIWGISQPSAAQTLFWAHSSWGWVSQEGLVGRKNTSELPTNKSDYII